MVTLAWRADNIALQVHSSSAPGLFSLFLMKLWSKVTIFSSESYLSPFLRRTVSQPAPGIKQYDIKSIIVNHRAWNPKITIFHRFPTLWNFHLSFFRALWKFHYFCLLTWNFMLLCVNPMEFHLILSHTLWKFHYRQYQISLEFPNSEI